MVRRTTLGVLAATVGAYVVGIPAARLLIIAGLPRIPLWGAILLGEVLVGAIILAAPRGLFRPPTDRTRLRYRNAIARFVVFTLAFEGFDAYSSNHRMSVPDVLLCAGTLTCLLFVVDWIQASMSIDTDSR